MPSPESDMCRGLRGVLSGAFKSVKACQCWESLVLGTWLLVGLCRNCVGHQLPTCLPCHSTRTNLYLGALLFFPIIGKSCHRTHHSKGQRDMKQCQKQSLCVPPQYRQEIIEVTTKTSTSRDSLPVPTFRTNATWTDHFPSFGLLHGQAGKYCLRTPADLTHL